MSELPVVTVTTDFGTADGYVGTMKGVILSIAPDARLVDLSQDIAPQDVRQAAYVLHATYPFFPPRTVHLVVVDPGVGSARRAIALRTPKGTFVGPDNGVFSYIMAEQPVEAVVELADPRYQLPEVSHTFHGRDIFAPAAAHLAAGVPLDALGPPVPDPITLPLPQLAIDAEAISGEVLHTDHFGNVITSIGRLTWRSDAPGLTLEPAFRSGREALTLRDDGRVRAGGRVIDGIHRAYASVERGELLALVGSGGFLEVAVREGSAAERLELRPGDPIVVQR
jgi:hypothetical protein